jgi:hypothetical protein
MRQAVPVTTTDTGGRTAMARTAPVAAARRQPRPDGVASAITGRRPQSDAPAPPAPIHVSIGRVEVRATIPPPASPPPAMREPRQSLADFLSARDAGRKR